MIDKEKREAQIKLLRLLADHFEENKDRDMANSKYDIIFRPAPNCEQMSYIDLRIPHYGVTNYYGKEIADAIYQATGKKMLG